MKIKEEKLKNKKLVNFFAVFGLVILIAGIILLLNYYFEKPSKQENQNINQTENSNQNNSPKEIIEIKNFKLSIDKLEISAPIIPRVDGDNKDGYFKALQDGVAHYKGTKLPAEGGNIFIFGHSSYYASDPGKYKEIFNNLNNLEIDDRIEIYFNDKFYNYFVTQKLIVEPNETKYLNDTENEQLTLMTCWPPGTYKQRLIVIAKPKI